MSKLIYMDNAATTQVYPEVLNEMLSDQYFEMPYPKSTGREKYNDNYLKKGLI